MKSLVKIATFLLLLTAATEGAAQFSCHNGKASQFNGYDESWHRSAFDNLRSDTMDVLNYNIFIDITSFASQTIRAACEVTYTPKLNGIGVLSLDLLQLNIDSISSGMTNLNYSYNDTLIVVQLPSTMNIGDTSSLTVYYNGSPQADASWGGWYFNNSHAFNLGVGFSADPHNYGRVWHPCFDNFSERATYDFTIWTLDPKTAYCNGERVSITNIGGDTLETTWSLNKGIPSYLASVAVANYTHVSQEYVSVITGDTIPIWLIGLPGDTTSFKQSFTNIDLAIQGFEEYFGPHQWNKVGFVLVPFNSGAMEHATNIAYPGLAANGSLFYETLMAHELAHHWWGDHVTCATEEEMWINEGMASYSEKLFLEFVYGKQNYLNEMRGNHQDVVHRAHLRDSGYYALDAVPHKYTYGDHSYNKGSDVIHTMRGYMGDSLFFVGMRSAMQFFADDNVSSAELRDHLNTIPGVDVSDFFDDWIFSPGFSHFSIDSFNVVSGNGPYDIQVFVKQKLRATNNYHDNVPLQIRLMDNNWNLHNEEVMMSGDVLSFTFSCPFIPEFAGINMDEKVNDATTAETIVISGLGLQDMPYAYWRVTPSNVGDSVMIRVEHNFVPADPFINQPGNMIVSRDRYWNVHAIGDLANFEGTMRFEYNGQNTLAGNLDNLLLADLGGQPFLEDSIVLLYRPTTGDNWVEHGNYSINFTGSATDKKGIVTINQFDQGQFALGYLTPSVDVHEIERPGLIMAYPNPANDEVRFDLPSNDEYKLMVHDMAGRSLITTQITGGTMNTSGLSTGMYIISVFDSNDQFIGTCRLSISR